MKDPGEPLLGDHVGPLLLPYLEEMLSEEDRARCRGHLDECDACFQELLALQETIDLLRKYRDALCPEPWELYEFVAQGLHQDRGFREHLEACPSCAAEAERYRSAVLSAPAAMPEKVLDAYRKRFDSVPAATCSPGRSSKVTVLSRWIRLRSRNAVLTAVAVAAAAMLAIMIFPGAGMEPMFGLSAATWDEAGGLVEKGMPIVMDKPKIAFLLVFRGFRSGLPQANIDTMYEGLRPTADVEDRFQVVQPAAVKTAISERGIRPEQRAELLQVFSNDLGASGLLLIEVTNLGSRYEIRGEFVDTTSGRILRSEKSQVSGEATLAAGMRPWLALISYP